MATRELALQKLRALAALCEAKAALRWTGVRRSLEKLNDALSVMLVPLGVPKVSSLDARDSMQGKLIYAKALLDSAVAAVQSPLLAISYERFLPLVKAVKQQLKALDPNAPPSQSTTTPPPSWTPSSFKTPKVYFALLNAPVDAVNLAFMRTLIYTFEATIWTFETAPPPTAEPILCFTFLFERYNSVLDSQNAEVIARRFNGNAILIRLYEDGYEGKLSSAVQLPSQRYGRPYPVLSAAWSRPPSNTGIPEPAQLWDQKKLIAEMREARDKLL
jgi:hypothetical protein